MAEEAAPNELAQRQMAFINTLTNVVGLNQYQRNAVTAAGVDIVETLALMDEETLLGIFPPTGANRLVGIPLMKLKALRAWTISKTDELEDGNDIINVVEFENDTCTKIQRKLSRKSKGDRTDQKSAFSGTLDTFTGRVRDWPTSHRKLLAYLGQQRGVLNLPLIWVIRIDADKPEHLDELQEEIWNTAHHGSPYDKDNYTVFQILKQWTADGTADTYVDRFNETSDGRGAYLLIVQNYEGDDARQTAIASARNTIQTAHYIRDSQNFDDYCNKHTAANNELKRRNVPLDGPSQVIALLAGIKNQDFKSIKPHIIGSQETSQDLSKAISTFKTQIQRVFNYPKGQIGDYKRREQRYIGSIERGGGRTGGGRNFRGGRGGRGGRNGRGGFNRGGGNNGSEYVRGRGNQGRNNDKDIPGDILAKLTPKQRAMMYMGRDEMRKRNANNSSNDSRSIKVARTGDNDNDDVVGHDDITEPASNSSASSRFGQSRTLNNNSGGRGRAQMAVKTGTRVESSHMTTSVGAMYRPKATNDYNGRYRLEMDSRADTMCCGKGFVLIGEIYRVTDVSGFHPSMPAIENVSIRTCATAFDHEDGETLILVFGQALWFGEDMEHSSLTRSYALILNNTLKDAACTGLIQTTTT